MAQTLLFIYGADTFRARKKLDALKKRYVDASLGDTNLAVLDAASLNFSELVRQVQALPFLAKTRLVIITNLLMRGKKELQAEVAEYLPKIPDSTVVCFFENGQPDKRTSLFRVLAKGKYADEFAPLEGSAVIAWLQKEASARLLQLSPVLAGNLAAAAQGDLWRLTSELDKLAAYYHFQSDSLVTAETIDALVHTEQTSDVFALIRAIGQQRTGEALRLLSLLIDQGEAELYILAMIAYQFRLMLTAAEAYTEGARNSGQLARVLGVSPYVAGKTLELVRSTSLDFLIAGHRRLVDYDVAIKTGRLQPRHALELLIVELSSPMSVKS